MILFCVVFAIGVGYIAYRGANASTGVNLAVNIVQISALLVFAVIAIGYRATHADELDRLDARPRRHRDQVAFATFAKDVNGNVATFKSTPRISTGRTTTALSPSTSWRTTAKATPRRTTTAIMSSRWRTGNPIPALTYKVEVDDKGDPKSTTKATGSSPRTRTASSSRPTPTRWKWTRTATPRRTTRPSRVRKRTNRTAITSPTPKGQNLASDQHNPDDHATYYPDHKGVYVLDDSSAGNALALTIPDKPAEGQRSRTSTSYVAALNKDVASYEAGSYAQTAYYRAADDKGQPTVVDDKHPRRCFLTDELQARDAEARPVPSATGDDAAVVQRTPRMSSSRTG